MLATSVLNAETHLLVTNITELDPTVLSFSPDGDAFYVYNQSIFAQKYLPQYFKHSNYGSFVRQLNLYGFASSRHKDNANVIVWSHQYFKRDRKDLLKNIKRTVKKSTKKPSHVYVTPRSTSASVSSEEVTSSPSNEDTGVSGETISRQVSSKGDEWLESELAYLKQQNRNLEDKLDLLLKITLTLSPSSLEEFQLGEKRRRTHVKSSNSQSYQSSHHMLDTIRENSAAHNSNNIEPMPYMNENRYAEADQQESMKAFVDIMLNGDEKEDANSGSDSDIDDSGAESPNNVHEEHHAATDAYEDELMAEAMHAIMPEHELDDEEFNLSFDDNDVLPEDVPAPATFTSVANRAMDKSSGPEAVLSSDSFNFTGDIEEGNAPFGVHIVSAHAELVEDDGSKSDDSVNDRRVWRKKVMCMLTVIFVTLLIICITVPTVVLKQKNKNYQQKHVKIDIQTDEKGRPFPKPFRPKPYQEDSYDAEEKLDDDAYYAFDVGGITPINVTSATNMTQARSGFIENLFSDRPVKHNTVDSSRIFFPKDFTLNVEGLDFKCTQVPPLL